MKTRLTKLRQFLRKENLDAAFIAILDVGDKSMMPGVRYLTGFSGTTAGLFVTPKAAFFITDSRYALQAEKQIKGCKLVISLKHPIDTLEDIKEAQVKNLKIILESNRLTIQDRKRLQKAVPRAILVDGEGFLEEMMILKEKGELSGIRQAVKISDTAFERVLGIVRPGIREIEVAAELEYQMKMLGSEEPAFETIVASGYRSALPHGVASGKKIEKGDLITFDFGALYDGYCSDITRTVVLGKATKKQKKIYNTVLKAQETAIRRVKAGRSGKDVDAAARNVINRAGYGKYFGHGTGHGIGLEVHAGPRVSPKSDQVLKSNMVITIEPGIYLPGWGGVRIEDDVVVKARSGEVLNKAPKNLLEL